MRDKKPLRILTINPGSTSTKVAVFEGGSCSFSHNVSHDADKLKTFNRVSDELPYRYEMICELLTEAGIALDGFDAVVGRGGSLLSCEGGTYLVDDLLYEHARVGANGVAHPAQLGPQLARKFAELSGVSAFVVNPPDVDEYQDVARMTGIDGVYRTCHLHALNLKQTAIHHAESLGRSYEECNFVVCHLGGGVSVSAHRAGRMIDGYDIVGGEGPMAPTRCGSLPVVALSDWMRKAGSGVDELRPLMHKAGGFVSHCGTSDARELCAKADAGDEHARMVWETFIYQVEKAIGAMAAALHGDVDAILLGGGIVYSEELVNKVREACEFIAPVVAYPGEFEMEAMAAGAERVLTGVENAKHYTGKPAWQGFAWDKE